MPISRIFASIRRSPSHRPIPHEPISMPTPQQEISAAKPIAPTSKSFASGASATIAQPTTLYATTSANTINRSRRICQTIRRPSVKRTFGGRSAPTARFSWKRPFTLHTSAADTKNENALMPNAVLAPTPPTSTPPISGPTVIPRAKACETSPLAQARSSSAAKFGIAACDAGKNGISAAVARNAKAISIHGSFAKTSPAKKTAAPMSEMIITLRRSKESPSQPPIGVRIPIAANVARKTAETQTAEFVIS